MKSEMPELHTKIEKFYQGFICGVRVNYDTCNPCKHFTVRSGWGEYCKASEDFARELTKLLKLDTSYLNFLTPNEAKELMYCWIHESQNRYGKVNMEAPLYLKLKAIAESVLAKWKRKQSESHKGQHSSPQTEFKRGEHPSPDTEFKESIPGGVSSEDMQLRNSPEYRYWRSAIYKRDDYTCQQCKSRGVRLEAHHVKSFATHPELRFDVGNGITLCKLCHRGGDAKCRQANDLQ